MDQLKRPLAIPPEFGVYAEENGVFSLYSRMLSELLIHKPSDPLEFLHKFLAQPQQDAPRVVIYGPPASGQQTLSKLAARRLKAVHIKPLRLAEESKSSFGTEARVLLKADSEIPAELWAELVSERVKQKDCVNKGWVLEGFPRTRAQALALKAKGVLAKHLVNLSAPDGVLLERYSGKRVDSLTGDVYHELFHPPTNPEVSSRLIQEPGGEDLNMTAKLVQYHRHSSQLLDCYCTVSKTFDADQPLTDLFEEVFSFVCTEPRTAAPQTPRVLLLGPPGSGKSLQALHLAKTYNIVSVDCKELIRRTLNSDSKIADKMKPFHERGMLIPDDLVMSLLSKRLSQLDCSTRGWVLHGYPLTRDQAELLGKTGHKPNRVVFLNVPEESVKERLTLRRLDPVTGERYHLLFKPPQSSEVKDRLVTHPGDSETQVTAGLSTYHSYLEELLSCYTQACHINADQDPLAVFESIETMLINPLPKQPAPTLQPSK